MTQFDHLLRENIKRLTPYSTARDEYDGPLGIYLDANENPFQSGYNRYPDPHQRALKQQLAGIKGTSPGNIFIGNGSDEAIDILYRIFCEPGRDNALSITPSYGMYRVSAAINDIDLREVPLGKDFAFSARQLLSAADGNTKLAFLCSPNNPSGNLLDPAEVERFINTFEGITVVDEAYIDFANSPGLLPRLAEFPRLVILQTLSKAWGMAGLRLGMAFAHREIVAWMSRVKYPYNINGPTQQRVAELIEKGLGEQVDTIKRERERLLRELPGLGPVQGVFPSEANFILLRTADPRRLYRALIEQGVIVRDRSSAPGCAGCLRITVGTPEENSRLLELLREYN
ncbi:MAG: histidinol-phosphate transaminase [Alistipes sp.]|nr:histidinol-phosphate transaminase [Alistipes sp.]